MGIQGLLKALEAVGRDIHVREYAGMRVGVDGHCWLHAGISTCAVELATGEPCRKHIDFCMRRTAMLRRCGIDPVLVFDGDAPPEKQGTNEERAMKRRQKQCEGEHRLRNGDLAGARACFVQAVPVGPEMLETITCELRSAGIKFIVAPFEADSQLAYLSHQGYVDAVISEDSDMLALGCTRVLFKLQGDGHGREICLSEALQQRSFEQFQASCILMGCDYLPRLPRVGPKTAFGLVDRFGCEPGILAREARRVCGINVPMNYVEDFKMARDAFSNQAVLDPVSQQEVLLREHWRQPLDDIQHTPPCTSLDRLDPVYHTSTTSNHQEDMLQHGHSQAWGGGRGRPQVDDVDDPCGTQATGGHVSYVDEFLSEDDEMQPLAARMPKALEDQCSIAESQSVGSHRKRSRSRASQSGTPPDRRQSKIPRQEEWSPPADEKGDLDSLAIVAKRPAFAGCTPGIQESVFISDSYAPAQLCRMPQMTWDEFLQQERGSRGNAKQSGSGRPRRR